MTTRTSLLGLAAGALALLLAAPAVAAPAPSDERSERGGVTDPRRAPDADLPTDRPIVATVIDIDQTAGTVMLATPHGHVALSVSPELAERLSIGDVVVVRITDEDDSPAASPREGVSPREEPTTERQKI